MLGSARVGPMVPHADDGRPWRRAVRSGDRGCSDAALDFAFAEAALRRARLLAVHAWFWSLPTIGLPQIVGMRPQTIIDPHEVSANAAARLDTALAGWREKYPDVQAGWEVVQAHPGRVLAGASARADLTVLGRHHEDRGVDSVTYAVLSHAHGPVACIPGSRP
ncbi:MAG: universal stress protein [Streptosporangiaceae bacterium]|nr:universal stress protein [Streptosporangiaceae bacterium]